MAQPTGTEAEVFNLLLNTLDRRPARCITAAKGKLRGTLGISGEYQSSDSRGIIPLVPDARLNDGRRSSRSSSSTSVA